MLKKIFRAILYLAIILSTGFALYFYYLKPNLSANSAKNQLVSISTEALFESSLPNEKGLVQSLKQYKGKIIVLNFWATWCPPCREEMPELNEIYSEYRNKNVVVLGIAIDELGLVKSFSDATPVSYPLFAAENEGMGLSTNLGNSKGVLPYTVIINSDGNVIKTYFGRISKPLLKTTLNPLVQH